MLDIGIGLVIIYLAGSILVSAIQELIASLLQWRSQHLKQSILQMMLNDPSAPQLQTDSQTNPVPSQTKTQLTVARELQNNIYKSSFVQSLNHASVNFLGKREEITEKKYKELFMRTDPSYLSSETFSTALIEQLKEELKNMLEKPDEARASDAIKQIKDKINHSQKIPTSLKETLMTLADRASLKASEADNKLLMFQKEIETWFDRSMDRASGVYKRNTQLLCFFLGFAIAIIFNLDSLFLAHRLSQDTAMRTALAGGAETIVKESTAQNSQNFDPAKLQQNINSLLGQSSFIAPITENAGNLVNCPNNQLTCPLQPGIPNFGKVFSAVVGWIITALAIYMGAPFWFEILGKLVNVRSTGKKS
ncbi:MAG: hypothetical protein DCF12_09490 [Snowella sp.]|nr:MAG: hypothetical protein DCF12_09490 [Snowella sp.]